MALSSLAIFGLYLTLLNNTLFLFFKTELLNFDLDQLIQESLSIKQRLQKETQQTQEKVDLNPLRSFSFNYEFDVV